MILTCSDISEYEVNISQLLSHCQLLNCLIEIIFTRFTSLVSNNPDAIKLSSRHCFTGFTFILL